MTGAELKKLLKDNKVNQSEIAEKLGMTPQRFYERLKSRNPAYSFVEKVLELAGITATGASVVPAIPAIELPETKKGEVLDAGDGYKTLKIRFEACMEENGDLKNQVIALQAELLARGRAGTDRQ